MSYALPTDMGSLGHNGAPEVRYPHLLLLLIFHPWLSEILAPVRSQEEKGAQLCIYMKRHIFSLYILTIICSRYFEHLDKKGSTLRAGPNYRRGQ